MNKRKDAIRYITIYHSFSLKLLEKGKNKTANGPKTLLYANHLIQAKTLSDSAEKNVSPTLIIITDEEMKKKMIISTFQVKKVYTRTHKWTVSQTD